MAIDQLLAAVLILVMLVNAVLFAAILRRGGPLLGSGDADAAGAADGASGRPKRRVVVAAGTSGTGALGAAKPPPDMPFWATLKSATASVRPIAETLPPDLAEFVTRPAQLDSTAPPTPVSDALPGASEEVVDPPDDGADRSDGHGRVEPDWISRPVADAELPPTILARLPPAPRGGPSLTLDDLTGLEGPEAWSRILEIENARLLRYRRPVTIVVAELEGMRRLAERLGEEPLQRLLPVVGDAFRKEARSSDWVARIGEGRFAILLAETDEIQAINYVERVRLSCEPWLSSAAVPMRLAIGWSSPPASGDLEFAIRRAEERMNADRRQPAKSGPQPRTVTARVMAWSSGQGLPDLPLASETTASGALSGAISAVPSVPPAPPGAAPEPGGEGLPRDVASHERASATTTTPDGRGDGRHERPHGRRRSKDEAASESAGEG